MATERNPFDPIPQVQVTQIEIEPEGDTEQEATIEYDNSDGGVIVEFKNPTEELLSDEQIEETDDEFTYHRGISYRKFERKFTLADDIVVNDAKLENGLLNIRLEQVIPEEKKPRLIDVK